MVSGKKLMILGANPETIPIVEVARLMGVHTIVVDPVQNSPAKKIAHESYCVDGLDVDALYNLALKIKIDGVLLGVADILVPSYFKLCKKLGLPCYVNSKSVDAFGSKDKFNQLCHEFGIDTTPSFNNKDDVLPTNYPVLVKPVDSGAGIGISVCYNDAQLNKACLKAETVSKSGRIQIEKFMQCDDMAVYCAFHDGVTILQATNDRYTTKKNDKGSPVCIGAVYPSNHQAEFSEKVTEPLFRMLKSLDVSFGVLNIQFFYDKGKFYAYDPGFRLQGEGVHYHVQNEIGLDQRSWFIRFALGHSFTENERKQVLRYKAAEDTHFATIWFLLKEGVIGSVKGLNELQSVIPSVKYVLQRLHPGDQVSTDMLGTEKQVFCRIYVQNLDIKLLRDDVDRLLARVSVFSLDGANMILDAMGSEKII